MNPETVLSICTDCAMLTANGETEGIDVHYWHPDLDHLDPYREPTPDETEAAEAAYLAEVDRQWPVGEWIIAPGCPRSCEFCHGGEDPETGASVDQCEPAFSWSACELCGCHLGGDRHPAVALRR